VGAVVSCGHVSWPVARHVDVLGCGQACLRVSWAVARHVEVLWVMGTIRAWPGLCQARCSGVSWAQPGTLQRKGKARSRSMGTCMGVPWPVARHVAGTWDVPWPVARHVADSSWACLEARHSASSGVVPSASGQGYCR
jgi:hypothetical protein